MVLEEPWNHAIPLLRDKGAGHAHARAEILAEVDLEPREVIPIEIIIGRAGAFAGYGQTARGLRPGHGERNRPENENQKNATHGLERLPDGLTKPGRCPGKNRHGSPLADEGRIQLIGKTNLSCEGSGRIPAWRGPAGGPEALSRRT